MPANTKLIKRRIASVTNTKKMTKAMEMVSAAKMRKSVDAALNTRLYAQLSRELLEHLSYLREPNVALLERRPVQKMLVILVSSNRGLCGSFNSNLFRKTKTLLKDTKNVATHRAWNGEPDVAPAETVSFDIMGIGKKSVLFAKREGYDLIGVYDALSERPYFDDITPIAKTALEKFVDGAYDKVVVAYTEYQSSLTQEPKLRQLLPIAPKELEKMIKDLEARQENPDLSAEQMAAQDDAFPIEGYLFEPDFDRVLEYVLPRLVEIQLYQAVLESSASEQSARMVAMKNASEAAGDMIEELKLHFNKARQAGITQEIAEIAGGAAALE